jgi:hypothetical protein
MRSKRVKRQATEKRAAEERPTEASPESAWSELEETLHEVLAQLPAKYRTPLIYCYLEGWTQEEVARQLGKPLGTVRSWLARGRELFRKRLQRRGISLSVEGASAALLASACATAEAVPPPLRIATSQAAHLFAAGGNAMTLMKAKDGQVSPGTFFLTQIRKHPRQILLVEEVWTRLIRIHTLEGDRGI